MVEIKQQRRIMCCEVTCKGCIGVNRLESGAKRVTTWPNVKQSTNLCTPDVVKIF
jgi:hypothetical protein